ncbi:MAG: NADH-quinone oxidoreductase subunit NuoE [Dehalococcoidia bacterium]|nr:NADH-quinone oxidoreductase subunit NuoE [Dehalococcoidia bacterium]MDZ4246190.1 NADH-quinone oxidoreductase subunit NuoE [Dehalococcoidia bacterium]
MKEKITEIFTKFTDERDNLIPLLQKIQEELGYLPEESLKEVAKFLHIPESEVFGVGTFYSQFKLKPGGKKTVVVCRGTACHVKGGARIQKDIEKMLGVAPGETTPDMEYTLETVACIGACALAPNVVVDKEIFGQVNARKIKEMFAPAETGTTQD